MKKINNGDTGAVAAQTIYDNDLQALLQWKAEEYPANTIVFKDGRFYKNNAAVIATDVPGASTKWVKLNTVDLDVEGGALSFSVAKAMLSGFMGVDTSQPSETETITPASNIGGGHFLTVNNTYNNNGAYPDAGVVYNYPVGEATRLRTVNLVAVNPGAGFAAVTGLKKNGTVGVILPWSDSSVSDEHILDISEYQSISVQTWASSAWPTLELLTYPSSYADVKKYIDKMFSVLDFFINPYELSWTELEMPQPGENANAIINTALAQYAAAGTANGSIQFANLPANASLLKVQGNFTAAGAGVLWIGAYRNSPGRYDQLLKGLAGSGAFTFDIDRSTYDAFVYSRIYGDHKYYIGVKTKLPITIDSVKKYIDDHVSSGSALSAEKVGQMSRPTKLLRLEFNTPDTLPISKDSPKAKGDVLITDMQGLGLKKFASIEVQGSSSALYPKKNWTFALFNDAAMTDEFKLRVGNWCEHSEFVYKANWIDATHARNLISNHIWEDIVQNRKYYPKRENEIAYTVGENEIAYTVGENEIAYTVGDTVQLGRFDSGALTHVDGVPCELYINGTFYGIGSFNLGKKRENYDLNKDNQNHIQLAAETHADFYNYNPAQWEIRNPKTPDGNFLTKINAWFAANALSGAAFKNAFETNHDLKNAIDFFLLAEFIQSPDMYTKNLMVTSWDGVKFYFLPYDMDTTFGLQWDGASWTGWTASIRSAGFWSKFYTAYSAEVKARYAELKAAGIFTLNNVYKHADRINKTYGIRVFKQEQAAWTAIPSNSVIYASYPQIYDWTIKRIAWLDSQYS